MREMFKATKLRTNNGRFVGHISPEAAEGSPLAVFEDWDLIIIGIPYGELHLRVLEEKVRNRLTHWKRPEPKFKKRYLALYARFAEMADKGVIIRHRI